jgi:hypothetical protein
MEVYRGFEGEVPTMEGLDIINAQGNYDQGRGADGLSAFTRVRAYRTSRYGSGVPMSDRPPAISGKPLPPPGLDPQYLLPRLRVPWERGTRGPTTTPAKIPGTVTVVKISPPGRVVRAPVRRPLVSKAAKIRRRQQFVNWLKNWAPQLYARAKAKADAVEVDDATLGQLAGWWETFTENLTEVGGAVLQYKTQKAILDAQLERMRAGLPPLQTSEYAPTVAVKVDPGTTAEITGAIGAGFGKMLPFLAIGGVVILLMMRRR